MEHRTEDGRRKTATGHVFLLCYLLYASIYIARLNLSMAAPGLVESGILDTQKIGILGGAFSVIYAAGRLCNGILTDRIAPYVMIGLGLIMTGCANLLAGIFPPFVLLFLLWGLNAWAQSMLWSAVMCVVSAVYPGEKSKKMAARMVSSVAAGNIAAILLDTWFIETIGLAAAFFIPGLLTAAFGILAFFILRGIRPSGGTSGHLSVLKMLGIGPVRKAVWPSFLHGLIKDSVSLWMTVFFADRYGLDLRSMALYILFIPVIGLAARIAYPFIYRLFSEDEEKTAFYSLLVMAASSAFLLSGIGGPVPAIVCLSLIYAAASMVNTSYISVFPMRYAATGNVASASGLLDFVTYLGHGLGSLLFGFLIAHFGYGVMFALWCVAAALAAGIIRFVRAET
ncbi:MAG: MFS transporter [Lachnospiraceae bacterium]|nr:MFS transporter [Lachnospiraceae bacterium]